MSAVLAEHVIPWLRANARVESPPVVRTFLVCGIGESDIVTRLGGSFPGEGLEAEYCARPGRVEVRIVSPDSARGEAVEQAVTALRAGLGDFVFTEGHTRMEEVVGRLLRGRGATLATAESCTGGLVGARITEVGGSSAYYLGGVVAYSNESKRRDLGVDPGALERLGAVSEEVARQMAAGVRLRFGSDYGLSVTGIAGPSGGTPDKPAGLVYVGVADAAGAAAREHRFGGGRDTVREWSAQMALDFLRRRLLAAE
jgi:nicotinamide-nucleotide amidase